MMLPQPRVLITFAIMSAAAVSGRAGQGGGAESAALAAARKFIADHEARIRPLEKAVALAWWRANTSGNDEEFKAKEEAQNRLDAAMADPARFGELKQVRAGLAAPVGRNATGERDPTVERELEILHLQYLEKQVDPELLKSMTARANAVEKAFNVFRARVDGKELTDSEVRKVLKESKDSQRRKSVWEASKGVGAVVEADLKELVKLRNQAARKLGRYLPPPAPPRGHMDFHALQLALNEQSQAEVLE